MKRGDLTFVFLISFLVVVIAGAIYILSTPELLLSPPTTSTRSFDPPQAEINKPTTVNLDIDFKSGTPFYDLVEFIPQGFDVKYDGLSVPRPDLASQHPGTNPIQFLNFNPGTTTHSYVLVPDQNILCPDAPGTTTTFNGLYLAPPARTTTPLGTSNLEVKGPEVIRKFTKTEINGKGGETVYLFIYPACAQSYKIDETVPSGWTIRDSGGGQITGDTIRWEVSCPGICESRVIAYQIKAPTSLGPATFSGKSEIPNGASIGEISGETEINIVNADCTRDGACNTIACQGDYCNIEQTSSCFGVECVNSCTGRPGFYCSDVCSSGDRIYIEGGAACGASEICCESIPQQTCTQTGGYCVDNSQMLCPPGFENDKTYDVTCNGGVMPPTESHSLCCKLSGEICRDSDADNYDACNPPNGDSFPADCNDGNSAIHPGATETCNGIDDDCNGAVDDFCSYPSLLFVPPTPEGTVSGNSIFVNISSRYLGPKDQYVFLDVDNYNGWLLWLPMENIDGNGVPTDQSPRGQSLVKAGDAHQGSVGRFGNGFIFDGVGDEVNVTTGNFNFPGQYSTFTISFWFKNNAGGGTGGQLLSYGNWLTGQGWEISYQGAGGALQFNAYRSGGYNYTRASGSYVDNNWHHLVFTKDYPSYGKFYIDGVDVTAPDSYPYHGWIYIQTITSPLVLGRGFNGELDDVMIWNKVLTLSEIRSLYNATAYPYARNITGQTHASHTLHAYAISGAGKRNETVRTVTLIP